MPAAAAAPVEPPQQQQQKQKLVVGRAVWWIPAPVLAADMANDTVADADTDTQKLSFAGVLKDLLRNLSFHCYGKLVEHGRRFQERFFWLIFHITALSILIAFLWDTYKNEKPALVTTIYDQRYPISQVEFPAVAVCSLNRISRRAVWRYASELSGKDPEQRNATYFFHELRAFGVHYTNNIDLMDYERAMRFQSFLDSYDTEPQELFFNTRQRLFALTPNCSELLVSCRLANRPFDCQQFQESLTAHGLCCTFNFEGRQRSFRRRYFGSKMGLVLTLKSTPRDDFFKIHAMDGFLISIYEPHSYPDSFSGGVAERFAASGYSTLLPIYTKIVETVQEARSLTPNERNCFFEDEIPRGFTSKYSFSKCITACRARSIRVLCECVPFDLPDKYFGDALGNVYCTLHHMECIKRYDFKWMNVITSRANMSGLEHEMEDALYCPECLPSCTETRYNVRSLMRLVLGDLHKPTTMTTTTSIDDDNSYDYGNGSSSFSASGSGSSSSSSSELAVVSIYFAETHIQYFRQIIKNAWYETFGTIGNICGIIAGFSLIGICELLFFLAKQLWHICKAEVKAEHQTHAQANGRAKARQQEQQQQRPMELLILP